MMSPLARLFHKSPTTLPARLSGLGASCPRKLAAYVGFSTTTLEEGAVMMSLRRARIVVLPPGVAPSCAPSHPELRPRSRDRRPVACETLRSPTADPP